MYEFHTIITISREFGSGGAEIGRMIAERLNIKCYDKEMLDRAAADSGICQELLESHDEKPTKSFLYSLVMDAYSFGYQTAGYNDMPINYKIFLAQFDAIKKIAEEGPCVLIGRCADFALEDNPNVLSVFIRGDLEDRINRISKLRDITPEMAREVILKADKKRASYYNYYTNKRWGAAESYDVCINSSTLGIEGTVRAILKFAALKEQAENSQKTEF